MRALMMLVAMLPIAGCSPAGGPGRPLPGALQKEIEDKVREQLTDPTSAQFQWYKAGVDPTRYCFRLNSKNKMGGYVGFQPVMVLLAGTDDRHVEDILFSGNDSDLLLNMQNCERAGYPVSAAPLP